jgi:hypothetical protein
VRVHNPDQDVTGFTAIETIIEAGGGLIAMMFGLSTKRCKISWTNFNMICLSNLISQSWLLLQLTWNSDPSWRQALR